MSRLLLEAEPAKNTETVHPLLSVRGIIKRYGETTALAGVNVDVAAGAIVSLLGPSGCGKTTLLRIIAGLEHADGGETLLEGRPIDHVPTHRRGFGLMFQEYALFPHCDVAANVAFGLRMRNLPRTQIDERVAEMLDLVGLRGYERRRVYELSGGERQRVALARSLAPSPRLLMLDEPLGALDRELRERLLDELHAILKRVGVTSIYVTHDHAEAFAISDWLVLMNAGRIEQQGPPQAIYRRPSSVFAARFLGLTNLIEGRIVEQTEQTQIVDTPLGRLHVVTPDNAPAPQMSNTVTIVIRPEAATLAPSSSDTTNLIHATVTERSFRGSRTRLTVCHAGGQSLEFELDSVALPALGEGVSLRLRGEMMSVIGQ
jgi:ABC-type Fe3+/spermidine/putrescine transport system ATPase subunit